MAVVTFNRKELEELVGKKLSDEELKNEAPMMGCDAEDITEKEVEIEIFPDRPDLLSVEGFARSFKQFLGVSEGLKKYEVEEGETELKTEESVERVRPCITAGIVRDVEMTEGLLKSLMQAQEKIHTTLGRKRRKVAIGIHDMEDVTGPFVYKAVDPESVDFVPLESDEKMNLLEIKEGHPKGKYADILEGHDRWPVIVDRDGKVLSFPPVINGTVTELSEETGDVFIDVTGTDQKAVEQALNLIVTMLAERGGRVEAVNVDGEKRPDLSVDRMDVDLDYVNRMLNLELGEGEVEKLLAGMGFGYEEGEVLVPCYRTDVMHPIDVVEDVAISRGYENFDVNIPDVPGVGRPDEMEEFVDEIRDFMVGFGFQEVLTSVLTNRDKQFLRMKTEEEEVVEARTPLSERHGVCRLRLLPGLMDVLKQNKHRSYPQKVFETGDVVKTGGEDAENRKKLAAAVSDKKINYTDLASILDSLFGELGVEYELQEIEMGKFIESRAAAIKAGDRRLGSIGEVHPDVLENWFLEKPVVVFEIDLRALKKLLGD